MTASTTRVAVIGAGRMGWPMAQQLHDAGFDVAVLSRNNQSHEQALDYGVSCCSTIAEAVAGADITLLCVLTEAQLREVCFGDGGVVESIPAKSVLVVHTTCDPQILQEIAQATEHANISVVDAAVSGGPHDIRAGGLTLFVGADEQTFARVQPALATYGNPVFHIGGLGTGQLVKLLNNALLVANLSMASEVLTIGASLGIAEESLLAALPRGSGTSRALELIAGSGSLAILGERLSEFLAKDITAVQTVATRMNLDLGLIGTAFASDHIQKYLRTT
jgi:3-hydroxyisobutyrate dehydrogenase-like beta-hydroxyacid dehydrogenase